MDGDTAGAAAPGRDAADAEAAGAAAPERARALARKPLELGSATLRKTAEGLAAAADYGDSEAEYRLLRAGCGLLDRLWVEHLELTGEDRRRFLNGLVTGETKSLEPGAGRFVFVTSAQGRILAEARVTALAESLLLEVPAGRAGPMVDHLSRYVVADRVEIRPLPELRCLALLGPEAWRVAARLAPGAERPDGRWSAVAAEWRGTELVLAREERLGVEAVVVRVAEEAAGAVAEELLREGEGASARPVGFAAAEALRVERGLARFGPDFGDERFPQEVGESDALDFEKGCYLGQEVVARIHYRGRVNHRLCGLRLGDAAPPPPGSVVELDGAEVGRSGSALRSPAAGETIALSVLHRRAERGAAVDVSGVAAEVVDLPFAGE